ncbi:hypothetical protein GAGA_4233 [Paraglaciecola agarilytica NO2]|uniref:Uncharacterized protein n=1 Tax=Paraglaciecola agarilytica NO2 TaxID=1125747 RepID=A0ABQ0ICQ5_9ALTE|nr:hypothetical protein GAGA_4233 [Paraglaciecola agarilytica NO2]
MSQFTSVEVIACFLFAFMCWDKKRVSSNLSVLANHMT